MIAVAQCCVVHKYRYAQQFVPKSHTIRLQISYSAYI